MITARFAGEQGREVFALPGSPLDPRAAGTNNLLRQGATLTTRAADVVENLAPIMGQTFEPAGITFAEEPKEDGPPPAVGDTERERLLCALGPSPIDIDELIRAAGVEARKAHIVFLELDLAGRLQRHGRQLVSLTDPAG